MFERSEFLTMMPHTVTIAPFTGRDLYGNLSHGAPVSYRCRIVGKVLALRRTVTEDQSVIFDIYLDAEGAVFSVNDQLILPADAAFVDQTPEIFAIARVTDEDGHHHVKMQCGWMYHRQGQ